MMHNHHLYNEPATCCCCSARTGLRFLGWWWLIICVLSLFYIWTPILWLQATITEISLFPCFLTFFHMHGHGDHPDDRHKLYKTYKVFAVYFGLPAMFLANIRVQYKVKNWTQWLCDLVDDEKCTYVKREDLDVILMKALINIAILAIFRIYLLSVMKRYHSEGL